MKKLNLKINKKVISVAILTIVVLANLVLAVNPTTNAIFKKKKDYALAFNDGLKDIYKSNFNISTLNATESITLADGTEVKSTETNVILKVTFDRDATNAPDSAKNETHKDIYKIVIPKTETDSSNVCQILNKQGSNYSVNTSTGVIRFSDNASENQKNNEVYISCPADYKYYPNFMPEGVTSGNYSNFNIKLYEHIEDKENNYEEDEFLYAKELHYYDYDEYIKQFVKLPEESIIQIKNPDGTDKSTQAIYVKFIELLTKHVEDSNYISNFKDYFTYINSIQDKLSDIENDKVSDIDDILRELKKDIGIFERYINDNDPITSPTDNVITPETAKSVLIDASKFNLLGVIRVPVENEDGELIGYGFKFDENFIGYVKTHNFYKTAKLNDGNFIYFSSNDASKIEIALKDSINKWAFENNNKNYIIGNESYTAKSLILKYIDTYLKDNGLAYSFDNLIKVVPLYKGTDETGYEYIALTSSALDYGYNYVARNDGIIRVSYYKYSDGTDNIVGMQNISLTAIRNLQTNGNISSSIANMLRAEIRSTSTDLYKTLTCRKDCTDFNRIYYSNGAYYRVTVTHNELEEYNEIKITKDTTLENIATGLYDSNVIATIKENEALNKAITCNTSTCKEYNEIYYNTNKKEYLLVKVKPNTNYSVNEINMETGTTFASVTSSLANININGIQSNLSAEGSLLNKAITCYNNCEEYNEVHFDAIKDEYLLANVTSNNRGVNKLTINKKDSFINSIKDNYSANLIESINAALEDGELVEAITCNGADCYNYNQIHFDGSVENNNYMILKITADSENEYNTITISKLKALNETTINEELIKNIDEVFIYTKEAINDLNNNLIKYLNDILNGTYEEQGESLNDPNYSIVHYYKI